MTIPLIVADACVAIIAVLLLDVIVRLRRAVGETGHPPLLQSTYTMIWTLSLVALFRGDVSLLNAIWMLPAGLLLGLLAVTVFPFTLLAAPGLLFLMATEALVLLVFDPLVNTDAQRSPLLTALIGWGDVVALGLGLFFWLFLIVKWENWYRTKGR
jgi:hypothetical protein